MGKSWGGQNIRVQQADNKPLILKDAINHIGTIHYTKKTKYVMGLSVEDFKVLIYHGSTGNGKSMTSSIKFLTRVLNSARDHQTFILAGRDIKALERRFIESNTSPFNWFPFKGLWTYKALDKGGARMTVKTRTGNKFIYLTPFNNVAAYSRVLGDKINGVFVDEAVEANEMFLEEIMLRINRTEGSWGIFTSNGGDPNHYFYRFMINKSYRIEEMIDGVIPTPLEEVRFYDTEGRDPSMLTIHMGLEDNPIYTQEQLDKFYTMYPVGSFMYNSKVLGVRGFSQNAPFSPYLTPDIWIKPEELHNEGFYPEQLTFSVDVGGHVFDDSKLGQASTWYDASSQGKMHGGYKKGEHGTTQGGHTVMVTIGWCDRNKKAVLLDTFFPNHMHEHENVERIHKRVYNVGARFNRSRKAYMFCDPAAPSFYSLLRDKNTSVGQVRPAIKRDNSINLDEQAAIAIIQQYMMNKNFRILDTPENRTWFYDSMVQANLEPDGKLVDNKSYEADIQDALKYQFTSMYRSLIRE